MRIALVHDWLKKLGGSERIFKEFHNIFPEAPVFVLFYDKKFTDGFMPDAKINPTFLQKIPFINKIYPLLFFLMPSAIESLDLSEFDLVLSSSTTFSKGLVLKPQTKHVCYCYSPTRFLWDWNLEYSRDRENSWLIKIGQHFLRIWDTQAAERVDKFIAISNHVKDRIRKYYKKDSEVIYPPLSLLKDESNNWPDKDYYLMVSRLHNHKNIGVAIEAFNKLGYPLVIVGDGPQKNRLKKHSKRNIKFMGRVPDEILAGIYKNCKAFIMPQEEDFGLAPLEAMSFGKPVLALRQGGAVEIISEGKNGEFFDGAIPESLADGVRRLNQNYVKYDRDWIINSVINFSADNFRNKILNAVKEYR